MELDERAAGVERTELLDSILGSGPGRERGSELRLERVVAGKDRPAWVRRPASYSWIARRSSRASASLRRPSDSSSGGEPARGFGSLVDAGAESTSSAESTTLL